MQADSDKSRKVFIDIDGVVADFSRRTAFLPDWREFFEDIENDPPVPAGVELARALISWFGPSQVAWMTGRYEPLRSSTKDWLIRNVYYDRRLGTGLLIVMRPDGDERPSLELKPDLVMPLNPYVVVDDEPSVIEAFLKLGVPGVVFLANEQLSVHTRNIENTARGGSLRGYKLAKEQ